MVAYVAVALEKTGRPRLAQFARFKRDDRNAKTCICFIGEREEDPNTIKNTMYLYIAY